MRKEGYKIVPLVRKSHYLDLYPAAYSSPVDNLHNHIFDIFRADPVSACVQLSDPE